MRSTTSNAALYEKVCAEQRRYREWLLTLTPAEVLDHAYEYSMREDIVMSMKDENLLSDRQAEALLDSPAPLSDIYKDWQNQETDHMDDIRETVICRADDVIRAVKGGQQAHCLSKNCSGTADTIA